MSGPGPRVNRNLVETADFNIELTADGDQLPKLPDSYRSSVLQSEESLSDYKSAVSDRRSWHKSTLSVATSQEEFHDCTLTPQLNPLDHPGDDDNENSASSQHSDHDGCEKSQTQKIENHVSADVDNISIGHSLSNPDRDDDDDLHQNGNKHRRISFMEAKGSRSDAQPSEISIFGKTQGNSFFQLEFSWKTILKVVLSIVLYFLDVYSDVKLAIEFMSKGLVLYCWLTAGVVIMQLMISAVYDVSQFRVIDRNAKKFGIVDKVPVWLWILRTFGLLLGIVPVYRTILSAIYAYKAKYAPVKNERTRFSLLHFAEKMSTFSLFIKQSYFESAPQMILQLYIVFRQQQRHEVDYAGFSQLFSVSTSLLSFAWSLREYDSNFAALFFNIDFTFFSNLLVFLWRLLTTFSQAGIISLCFSLFPLPFFFVCLTDYVVMIVYSCIMADSAKAVQNLSVNRRWTDCYTCIQQCRFVFFVNVFSALPLLISFLFFDRLYRETQVVCYYSYRLIYSSILIGCWAGFSQQPPAYRYGFFFAILVALIVGVLFLGLYFILYHKPAPSQAPKFSCIITGDDVKQENLANTIEFIKLVSLKNMAFSYQHLE